MMILDILMATYNGEKYLKEQIESILNQTYGNFNLLIQDDGSTDHTLDIIKSFQDSRIRLYQNEKNLGYIKNFESLIKKSTSELIMLSDQDDVWLPQKIEKSLKKYLEGKADLIYGDLIVTDECLQERKNSFWKAEDINPVKGNCWRSLSVYNVASGCTMLFNRKFIDKILPFPQEPLIHDWWITFVYSYYGEINFIKEKTILYRQHGFNTIGLTNDYYENTQVKIIDYISETDKFMNHRKKIVKRNKTISEHMLHYCSHVFPNEKKLLNYLKKNDLYFKQAQRRRLLYLRKFRLGIYRSRGKIGLLVFIVLNFPILLYILHPFMKLLKRRLHE